MSRSFKTVSFFVLSLAAPLAACSDSGSGNNAPAQAPPFLAITRANEVKAPGLSSAALSLRSVPGADSATTFYLAISEKALHEKWFLSAFLKQYFPGAVVNGAARSLGTRVVTFRERNGKVYVFDASDNYANSDTFDPALMVEAYPVVSPEVVTVPPGYVVIDPAAGMHRFGVTEAGSVVMNKPAITPFKVELAFSQNFRSLQDGATFEEIFTGSSTSPVPREDLRTDGGRKPNPLDAALDRDALRASGTLGLSFRRYAETPSFIGMVPPDVPHYFSGDTHLERDTGSTRMRVAHWAIRAGMKPIRWVLSSEFAKVQQAYPHYDIVGAVRRGITNWNEAFGFEALTAEVAKEGEFVDDDDTNVVYFDTDPRAGYAFANWRTNPNTGEVRGASVYFSSAFLPSASPPRPASNTAITQWGTFDAQGLCSMPVDAPADMSKKEQVEARITYVILHEIGHTLGLRHNFKGSLVEPSSSVMDYLTVNDSVRMTSPGAYDRDALAFLYGLHAKAALPAQPFCTDEQAILDPECAPFDTTDDPLAKDKGPGYQAELTTFLTGKANAWGANFGAVRSWLQAELPQDAVARTRRRAQKLQAWEFLLAALRPGVTAGAAPERIDAALTATFRALYADPKVPPPPQDEPLARKVAQDAFDALVGAHAIPVRRAAVVVLKKLQTEDAHLKLLAARTAIEAQKGTGPAAVAGNAKLDDLVASIDHATRPYSE
ncbi:zinc-dependent metalloprotease [Pendulispora rubella]|uniref:Zinc-dependent metalloprotease n=1 Tax=Pendulispora rubella TaxID=2741070 RepID=A0ABZ2LIK5_9BACT